MNGGHDFVKSRATGDKFKLFRLKCVEANVDGVETERAKTRDATGRKRNAVRRHRQRRYLERKRKNDCWSLIEHLSFASFDIIPLGNYLQA